jgi:hypothetical protein
MYFLKEYISTIEFDIGVPDKGCAFVWAKRLEDNAYPPTS